MKPTSVVKAALSVLALSSVVACGGDSVDFPAPNPNAVGGASGASGATSSSGSDASSSGATTGPTTPDAGPSTDPSSDPNRPIPRTRELTTLGVERFANCSYDGAYIAEAAYGGLEGMSRKVEETWAQRLRRPGVIVTQAEIDACVAELSAKTCGGNVGSYLCSFRGTLPDGAGCRDSIQCASGYCTEFGPPDGSAGSCGVCLTQREVGAACDGDALCKSGLFCSAGKCKVESALGEACESHDQCAGYAYCNEEKKCVTPLKEGSACVEYELGGYKTRSGCEHGSRCILPELVCSRPPPLAVKSVNESCAAEPGVRVVCHLGSCDEDTKKCVAKKTNSSEVKPAEKACP